ncbi:hypothetical protein VZT92_023230 [Zoarces viviparus]|uniref:Uncharacterized protein n=1 Tax=Zoarces viviparus TaxID=48416 RepID=A0AAW1E5L6_ZOAVI
MEEAGHRSGSEIQPSREYVRAMPPHRPEEGGGDGWTLRLEPSARPHGDATKARPEEQAIKEKGQRARMI